MQINERRLQGAIVLELHGNLTSPASASLLEAVRRVATAGPLLLVLHFGGVPSIDAAGLGALASAYRVVITTGGALRLAHVPRRVQMLVDLCRLDRVLATFDSIEAAVADGSRTAVVSRAGGFSGSISRSSLAAMDDRPNQDAAV